MGRCYSHLSSVEREEISRALALGREVRAIARQLGRSPSTVSRELHRNARRAHDYRATVAQWRAQRRARIARRPRRLADAWLRRYVGRRLSQGWSPQQIAARLRRDYPRDVEKRISHETIYAAIYIVPRGELRRTLIGCLRQHRKVRRRRHRSGLKRGDIPNPTPIAARPMEVEARLVPGHWEGDILKCQRRLNSDPPFIDCVGVNLTHLGTVVFRIASGCCVRRPPWCLASFALVF